MLKSLLYFQNRFHANTSNCAQFEPFGSSSCTEKIHPPQNIIHMHLVCDRNLWSMLESQLQNCSLPYLKCSFYDVESYVDFAQRIPNGHIAGPSAVAKLWIPYILPPWVIKTIVIDSDLLWNENALMLWKIFEQFKSTQMIGLAWEQQSYDPLCIEDPAKLLPRRGVNGGLVLMHLERMRNIRWDITIEQIIHQRLNQVGILGEGEQEVYSFLIHLKPDWYYGIPCEWNIQVYAAVAVRCCPIIWPDRRPDVSQKCFDVADNKSFGFGSLVHYDTPLKPEESGWENSVPVSTPRPGDVLTIDELRSRFLDLYARFQRIPMECFA
ncbi:glycosyltransferase-like protein LARGE2 [Clonorchis sinensis]|uniref:Glycosyltransferase-like protein LARGE2 n=1 Tax=Clonorchis sinensis TaxID=79923 RepID=G7YGP9_CLOSI|nr:glycosyltransferase-like protein LARGE2 [Clonorchis sinensis]